MKTYFLLIVVMQLKNNWLLFKNMLLYRAVLGDHYGLCKEQGKKEVVKEDYLHVIFFLVFQLGNYSILS